MTRKLKHSKIKRLARKHQQIIGRVRKQVLASYLPGWCTLQPAEVNLRCLWAYIQLPMAVPFPWPVTCLFVGPLSQAPWKVCNKFSLLPCRTCSWSSWVVVKQSTVCEAAVVTNRAFDLAAHQLYIFVVFWCVGSICSKLVMCLSSSHMILCEILSYNKSYNSKYTYMLTYLTYCFIKLWILMKRTLKKKKKDKYFPAKHIPVKYFYVVSTMAVSTDGAESHHFLGKFRDCSSYRAGGWLAGIRLTAAAGIRPNIHVSIYWKRSVPIPGFLLYSSAKHPGKTHLCHSQYPRPLIIAANIW